MFRYLAPLLFALALSGCAIAPPMSVFSSLNSDDAPREKPEPHPAPKRTQEAGLGSSIGNMWESVKSGLSFGGGATEVNAPGDDKRFALDPASAQQLINAYRAQKGLKPLRINPKLSDAAYKHSQDLSKNDRISHYGSDGSDTWDRVRRTGYQARVTAENVGTGQTTLKEVFRGWQNSPDHNANLLLADAQEMGIAMVHNPNSQFKTFWTLVLSSPVSVQ